MGDEVNAGRRANNEAMVATINGAPMETVGDYAAGCTFYRSFPRESDARAVWSMLRRYWHAVPGAEDHDEIHFAAEYSAAYARAAGFDDDTTKLSNLVEALEPSYVQRDPKRRRGSRARARREADTAMTVRTIMAMPQFRRDLQTFASALAAKRGISIKILEELGGEILRGA